MTILAEPVTLALLTETFHTLTLERIVCGGCCHGAFLVGFEVPSDRDFVLSRLLGFSHRCWHLARHWLITFLNLGLASCKKEVNVLLTFQGSCKDLLNVCKYFATGGVLFIN